MSAQRKLEVWTEEEYLEYDEKSPTKYEFINGQLYAMAGGTEKHADICGNIFAAAKGRLRGKPCKPINSDMKVKVESTGDTFYPDVTIHCPPHRFEGKGNHTLLTPSVIFEVLSPSNTEFDREGKLLFYEKIESLTDYVLVDAERLFVEHFSRTSRGEDWRWRHYTSRADVLSFPALQLELPLEEIYEEIELLEDWVNQQLERYNRTKD